MKLAEKYTYRVSWSEEEQEHVGLCAEFPSLSWLDKTKEDALKGIFKLVEDVLKDMESENEEIPEPLSTKKYSGKFQVRIPPLMHRKLDIEAHESKVSLNRLVSAKLGSGS
jgi:predicted HicB family RNase H-like nuclease